MRWCLLFLLVIPPAMAEDSADANRKFLELLEGRARAFAAEKREDRSYQKVLEQIIRVRKEFKLGGAEPYERELEKLNKALSKKAGKAKGAKAGEARSSEEAAADAAARARQAEEKAREELRRQAAENERRAARRAEQRRQAEREWARQQAEAEAEERMKREAMQAEKADSAAAAQAERRRQEFLRQAQEEISRRPQYRNRAEFERDFASHLKFAQASVAEGGLGYVPLEARQWVEKTMREKSSQQIYSLRFRYTRALKFAKTAKAEGGPGYERGYARQVALEAAMRPEPNGVEEWMRAEKAKLRRPKPSGCRGWFGIFD